MEDNVGEIFANLPQDVSETDSVIEEAPIDNEPEEKDKKKDNNEDSSHFPTKNPQLEETSNLELERSLLEERRTPGCTENNEKNTEADNILSQFELGKIKTEEFTYIGYIKNFDSKEHFGICNYNNGDSYTGQWLNNMKHGYGKYHFKNGNICSGEFLNDKQDGYAEFKNGNYTLKGFMKDFKPIKEAVLLKDHNEFFEGVVEFTGKKIIGFGKYFEEGEGYFLGEAQDYVTKQGYGIKFKKNKYYFKGNIEKNQSNGYCEKYYPDGSRFFGFYKGNVRNGFGLEFSKDGKASLAKYEDDHKNGFVIVYQKNAARIEIWHLGFKTKVVEKFETANIKQFLKISYPEYWWALSINYKKLFDTFMNVRDEEASKLTITDPKTEPKAEVKKEVKAETKTESKKEKLEHKTEIKAELKVELKAKLKSELKKEAAEELKIEIEPKQEIKLESKIIQVAENSQFNQVPKVGSENEVNPNSLQDNESKKAPESVKEVVN